MRLVALTLFLVLAGCSGSDDAPAKPTASAPVVDPAATPTVAAPTGEPVPEALSGFRCEPDGAGTFTASGVIENGSKTKATFQVTVQVGPVAPLSAKTKQVAAVAPGGSTDFQIVKIPAPAEGGTCYVQVVATK